MSGVAAAPVAAQVLNATPNDRGIPTIAPLIDAVVKIAVVSARPAQLIPLFRAPLFQPFLPPMNPAPLRTRPGGLPAGGG